MEKSEDVSNVLNIIRNSIRRDIIRVLGKGKAGFSEVMVKCGLDPNYDAGLFCYHLSELLDSRVISKADEGYELTTIGRRFWEIIETIEEECTYLVDEGIKRGERGLDEKREDLLERAEGLYRRRKFKEAIGVYREIYSKYREWRHAETALMMIGICYDNLGKYDKATKYFEKAVQEYPELIGFSESTYFYLGSAYAKKALEAFEKSVQLCFGVRDPDKFPYKDAKEGLETLRMFFSRGFEKNS